MKKKIIYCLLNSLLLLSSLLSAQTMLTHTLVTQNYYNPKPSIDPFGNFKQKFFLDFRIGATSSFATGDWINQNKTVETYQPITFSTAGLKARYQPFMYDKILPSFQISLGMEYFRRGLSSTYSSDYTIQNKAISDNIVYKEQYLFDNLSFPLMFRLGNKVFIEAGFCFSKQFRTIKKQNIQHSQTGAEVYDGGFNFSVKERKKIEKSLFHESTTNPRLAFGFQSKGKLAFEIGATYFSKTLLTSQDFKNIMAHCTLNYKINKKNQDL